MLIKVFGKWVNPDQIKYLEAGSELGLVSGDTYITFNGETEDHIRIIEKTPDEVGKEINATIHALK